MARLEENHQTKFAYQIVDGYYIAVHEVIGGYEYYIIGPDYEVIDRGYALTLGMSIHEAMTIMYDENPDTKDIKLEDVISVDFDELMKKSFIS